MSEAATIAPVAGSSAAIIAVPPDVDPWAKRLAATAKPFEDAPLAVLEADLGAIRQDLRDRR